MLANSDQTFRLKLVFPSHDGVTVEMATTDSVPVREIKETILKEYWRPDFLSPEDVGKLRLFQSGRELNGQLSLKENQVPVNPIHPTAVHVFIVHKTQMKKEEDALKSSMCMCCIS
eukprot:GHVS01012410.1.p1 GENE.GHVS01012410.1~~GHVS01012410.1.p1  ORF type:complete len:116 (+),score=12.95 GHVS01012410.1:36-383(+)